jgi:hypothetical protein
MAVSARIHPLLWQACDQGDAARAQALLERGACPWARPWAGHDLGSGQTPLERAAFKNRAACVHLLIQAEAALIQDGLGPGTAKSLRRWPFLKRLDRRNQRGALAWAAVQGHAHLLAPLARHCDPNARDAEGYRALDRAAAQGRLECCEILARMVDPLEPDPATQTTALMRAAASTRPESFATMAALMAFGGAQLLDSRGRGALHGAVVADSAAKCEALSHAAPPDQSAPGLTISPLRLACLGGHLQALRALAPRCPESSLRQALDLSPTGASAAILREQLRSMEERDELNRAAAAPSAGTRRL